MSTSQLTKEQQEKLSHVSFMGGVKGAAFGLGLGLISTVVAQRRSPNFQALTTPLKSAMIGSATVAGYLFGSEREAVKYENREYGYLDEEELRKLAHQEGDERLSAKDGIIHYLNQNRWSIIAGSWVVSMAGALTYSFSNKYLSTQQKLVQARMYAQAVTIAVLMASASLSVYAKDDEKEQKDEPDAQLRAVLELPHKEKSKQQ
ncbi:Replication factor C, subunit RFC4 [Umbelopsis sp. WA50703]